MNKRYIIILLNVFLFSLLIFGCAQKDIVKDENKDSETHGNTEQKKEYPPGEEYFINIGSNELGRIMILEYHVIGETDGRWARSYTSFREDLEKLYREGYVLISLRDMILGNIDTPAGKTPVVLTFDDGTVGQFRYIEDEEGNLIIDPKSAVGVLTGFFEEYPDFGLEATFFINYYTPFGQGQNYSKKKIAQVIELGMDIGNHSVNHLRMNTLSREEAAKELALIVRMVKDIVPGYEVDTFALPFGIGTKETEWSVKGEYNGTEYNHIGVLLVGSTPVPSPYNKNFYPYALERVQAYENNMDKWLDFFKNNPDQRFISDGYPEIISFPKEKTELLDTTIEKTVISY